MQDAWRAYLEMALGLTQAPRKKAQQAVGELVTRGGATAAQLQGLVEDLMSTGAANREALTNLVRYEVDRALGAVGLATSDEVGDLTTRVRDLERQLREAQARVTAAEAAGGTSAAKAGRLNLPAPLSAPAGNARKAAPTKAVARKAVAVSAESTPNAMPVAATGPVPTRAKKAGRTATAPTVPAKSAPAKSAPATPSPAKKAAAKKAVAKTAAAKTAPAKAAPARTAAAKAAPARTAAAKPAPQDVAKAVAKKTAAKKANPEVRP